MSKKRVFLFFNDYPIKFFLIEFVGTARVSGTFIRNTRPIAIRSFLLKSVDINVAMSSIRFGQGTN